MISFISAITDNFVILERIDSIINIKKILIIVLLISPFSKGETSLHIEPVGTTVLSRVLLPNGYGRIDIDTGSFQEYLRTLPLKPHKSLCKYYNGDKKSSEGIYVAVVDQEIGNRDLHQCADAVMRLWGEYLWINKQYDKIHFNFTNGFKVDYIKWMNGNRISVSGNNVKWIKTSNPSNSYKTFWKYMEIIFSYAGTLSLENEMQSVNVDDMRIGDVFIQGGSPGHAVIVIDMAYNKNTNETIFLLAQSYMPAQQTQILINPSSSTYSPWYSKNFGETLITPEWTFNSKNLKRFK